MQKSLHKIMATNLLLFCLCMIAYGVLLVASLKTLSGGVDNRLLAIAVTLSPMIPAAAIPWVIIRQLRLLDEMQRKIQLEALAFTSAAAALLTFSYGFLENIGFPQMPTHVVLPMICGLWQLGVLIGWLRYR